VLGDSSQRYLGAFVKKYGALKVVTGLYFIDKNVFEEKLGYSMGLNEQARVGFFKKYFSMACGFALQKRPNKNLDPGFGRDTLAFYSKKARESAIEITSWTKVTDSASQHFKSFSAKCENWSLGKNQIMDILQLSNEIDGHEFHYFYSVLPCHYIGEFRTGGGSVLFDINAGAFAVLHFRDTSIYVGYKKSDYKKYFLVGAGMD
jgi:hypothetical protein